MASKAVRRLGTELKEIVQTPPDLADARPDENNILRWVFVLEGAPDTPYEGGEYLGELVFPEQYPFKPPSIKMITPSGRFKTHTRLCFSMSDFHPEEWSPMWGVRQILIGLNSFMSEEATTYGSITTSDGTKRQLARASHAANASVPEFSRLFPERHERAVAKAAKIAEQDREAASKTASVAAHAGLAVVLIGRLRGLLTSWSGVVVVSGAAFAAALFASQTGLIGAPPAREGSYGF